MKKVLSSLGLAILGGVIALSGYKLIFEDEVKIVTKEPLSVEAMQTSYQPAFNSKNTEAISGIDFRMAAESTLNSVVHVKNTSVRTQANPFDIFFGRGDGVRKYEQVGTGSGVIISPDGFIVTNNHVIDNATEIEITLNNKKKYQAEIIGTDPTNDIALLKIDADEDLPFTPFADSDTVQVGEWVLAVGNPYNLTSTVTAGIISAKGRDLEGNGNIESFIQTDAAVNPGNSGGALVNTRGELVGINTAISSRTGSFVGYSFAVPSNIAKKIVDDILEYGEVQEAILGIMVDREHDDEGVKIAEAYNEIDHKNKLKEGDVILKIDNVKISKFSDLKGQLSSKRPGEVVNITIRRGDENIVKAIKLRKRIKRYLSKVFNWELKNLTIDELNKLGIKSGVKIVSTAEKYKEHSLKGYIIKKINEKEINNADEAVKILDKVGMSRYSILIEMINPDGNIEFMRFR